VLDVDPGTIAGLYVCPPLAEAYPVGLNTFCGLLQEVLEATPWLGPTKEPVSETALALRLTKVPKGPTTCAMKVFMVTASAYIVVPLKILSGPWKPERINPSFSVISGMPV